MGASDNLVKNRNKQGRLMRPCFCSNVGHGFSLKKESFDVQKNQQEAGAMKSLAAIALFFAVISLLAQVVVIILGAPEWMGVHWAIGLIIGLIAGGTPVLGSILAAGSLQAISGLTWTGSLAVFFLPLIEAWTAEHPPGLSHWGA